MIQHVNVQRETIERYVREGKIVADHTEQISEKRNAKYFLASKLSQYAEMFGWTIINDENRKDIFIDMVKKMTMSYSYKPIFLKGLLEYSDINGVVNIWQVVAYFRRFFDDRRAKNLIVEKEDSVYMNASISDEDILRNILTYPFKRYKDIGVVSYNDDAKQIKIDKSVWMSLSEEERDKIKIICNRKLEEYFSKLRDGVGQRPSQRTCVPAD